MTILEFLRKHKVIRKWKKNCSISGLSKKWINRKLCTYDKYFIMSSFVWAVTPEGSKFWSKLDDKAVKEM